MKKLLTLALALILAMGALGLVACGGGAESMTKDDFIAELSRREAATFADETLRYATVDCTYVEHSDREINADGTYKITYGNGYAYVSVEYEQAHGVQQQVLGLSSSMFNNMPEEILSALKLVKDGDNLECSYDAVWEGFRCTGKYVFDENGYAIYASESQNGDGHSASVEFKVKAFNKKSDAEETVVRYEFTSATSDEGYFADSYIELSGDNAAKSYLHGGEYIGTYTLNGDNISIRTYNGSVGIFWDGVIDGDVLTLTAGGIVVVYTKSAN